MAESPMVGARVPVQWQEHLRELARIAGRTEADIVREAVAQYLGVTDVASVKGSIEKLENRVEALERKLAAFGRLAEFV